MNYKRHPEDLSAPERLIYAALIPRVAHASQRVIALSESGRADIVHWTGLEPSRVVAIPGAPRTIWPGDASDDLRLLAAVGVTEPFVLSVAASYPHKNLERLIAAFASGTGELVVVGLGGRAQPSIERLIRARNDVRVLGWVDDTLLGSLYRRARLLAFPTLYEGFGLPILEAMAVGTPVLTSNYGAMAEVAGDAAELVDPRNVEAIASGLRTVLDSESRRTELRQRGLERAAQFSWTRTATRMREQYEQTAPRRAGGGRRGYPCSSAAR